MKEAMIVFQVLFVAILSAIPALIWGRRKHIGGWWTFILCSTSIVYAMIPGILALISSPSINNSTSKPNNTKKTLAFIILAAAIIQILIAFNYFDSSLKSVRQLGSINVSFGLSNLVIGLYLYFLGSGKIRNKRPLTTPNPLKSIIIILTSSFKKYSSKIDIQNVKNDFADINSWENSFYILENKQALGPYKIKELAEKGLKADTLVCRNGATEWSKAETFSLLKSTILFKPPSIPIETITEKLSDQYHEIKPSIKKESASDGVDMNSNETISINTTELHIVSATNTEDQTTSLDNSNNSEESDKINSKKTPQTKNLNVKIFIAFLIFGFILHSTLLISMYYNINYTEIKENDILYYQMQNAELSAGIRPYTIPEVLVAAMGHPINSNEISKIISSEINLEEVSLCLQNLATRKYENINKNQRLQLEAYLNKLDTNNTYQISNSTQFSKVVNVIFNAVNNNKYLDHRYASYVNNLIYNSRAHLIAWSNMYYKENTHLHSLRVNDPEMIKYINYKSLPDGYGDYFINYQALNELDIEDKAELIDRLLPAIQTPYFYNNNLY